MSDCFQCSDGFERRENLCQKKLLLNFLDPDMLGFFVWVIVLCIAAIILFAVIFGLLQARDHKVLCWKEKRHKETDKGDYKGMTLTREELENDLENYDIIRNRNFRHGSVPEDHLCRVHLTEPLTSPTLIKSSSGTGTRTRDSGGNTSQTHIEYAESNIKDYSASNFSDTHRNRTNSNISDMHRNRTNSNISDVHVSRNDSSVSGSYMHRTNSNISDKHNSRNSSSISSGHMVRNNSNLSNGHVSRNNNDVVHMIRTNSNVSDVHMNRNNSSISEGHMNRTNSNISDVLNRTNSNISDYIPSDLNPSPFRSSSGSNHKRGSRSSGHSRHNRMSSSRH